MTRTLNPRLSVVVVAHDMARELPRTLVSLGSDYQVAIGADEYEVIVVDNGSRGGIHVAEDDYTIRHLRVLSLETTSSSPAQAINAGLRVAQGEVIGVMIDGAHLLTPGVLHFALAGAHLAQRAVVITTAWILGCDSSQALALESGYNPAQEDALLERIQWPSDGYRLFEIGAPSGTSVDGWLQPVAESNALFLRRELWDQLGGADERFDLPGGGFLNLDLLRRAVELPDAKPVFLLGEGTFHQLHGNLAQRGNPAVVRTRIADARQQYESIRGRPWATPVAEKRAYVGTLSKPALVQFVRSAVEPVSGRPSSLGESFDRELWSAGPPLPPDDRLTDALVELAHREFRARRYAAASAVCRLARARMRGSPELLRILSLSSAWLRLDSISEQAQADVSTALGEAHEVLGEPAEAAAQYRAALQVRGNTVRAHLGLARLRMPGPDYTTYLANLHRYLIPSVYVEIGVATGRTLTLAKPPTVAIGVDPQPSLVEPASAETHLFAMTSDALFSDDRLARLLAGRTIALAFIDGLHHFDQALRDFANVERLSSPDAMVLIHDTVPLDEITQRRERQADYWTGDVWKVVACLLKYRPDLEVFTIPTPPAGLTVVTGLDPTSDVLGRMLEMLVDEHMALPFSVVEADPAGVLNTVANDWDSVLARLPPQLKGGSHG